MSYTPQVDSCAGRVCAYFLNNTDEELTEHDIVAKFGCSLGSVRALLFDSVSNHLLVKSRNEHFRIAYSRGTALLAKLGGLGSGNKAVSALADVPRRPALPAVGLGLVAAKREELAQAFERIAAILRETQIGSGQG